MNTRRKLLVACGLGLLVGPRASFAQPQPSKVVRIGILGRGSALDFANHVEAFRAGLRNFGYVEGKNIVIEYRWAEDEYDRLPDFAAELIRLKVDFLVTNGVAGTRVAKLTTSTIPIVMVNSADAVASGLVASLARPGGNVTGSTIFAPEISAKRLELVREAVPRATQVAVLLNPRNPNNGLNLQAMELTARSLKVGIQRFEARGPEGFDAAFSAMTKKRVEAVTISQDAMLIANAMAIANVAARKRIPLSGSVEFAEAGGLMGYGVNQIELWRRAAYFVDRILKGAKAGDIPVEQPTKFELVVNLKAAKALGITVPQSILVRADRVIE